MEETDKPKQGAQTVEEQLASAVQRLKDIQVFGVTNPGRGYSCALMAQQWLRAYKGKNE